MTNFFLIDNMISVEVKEGIQEVRVYVGGGFIQERQDRTYETFYSTEKK